MIKEVKKDIFSQLFDDFIPGDAPIVSYARVSTEEQKARTQSKYIESWAFNQGILKKRIKFIEATISSRKSLEERKFDEVYKYLGEKGILVTTEISRLGRSTGETASLIEDLLKKGHRIIVLFQGMDLNPNSPSIGYKQFLVNIFAAVAQSERDEISRRTKVAMQALKASGKPLGRKPGFCPSMYDKHLELIQEYLQKKLPVSSISKLLGIGQAPSLHIFIQKKKLIVYKRIKTIRTKKAK